jgi:hypothetical protein
MENTEDAIKRSDELYILMNFVEQRGIDFSSTLWQHTVMNNNASKMLANYDVNNADKTLEEIEDMDDAIDIHDPSQIIHSMKYITNIYN